MTDEKKAANSNVTAGVPGNEAPDRSRRKLAKAALVSPVIMTLSPRSVLGQGASDQENFPCSIGEFASLAPGATGINDPKLMSFVARGNDCALCIDAELDKNNGDPLKCVPPDERP